MADRRRTTSVLGGRVAHTRGYRTQRDALTAAVVPLNMYDQQALTITPTEPQREAWGYYHAMGEVNYAIGSWLANAASRCRLMAAVRVHGSDDPEPLTDGPFAEMVSSLGGGAAGQATMMKRMIVQISVPGESFLVTEDDERLGMRTEKVYSNTELRITGRGPLKYQVNEQRNMWRPLADESLVSRIWWPDDEIAWMASSPVMASLPILREIDMYNRKIMAILLSRVAGNGILLAPSEASFPAKPQFKDSADPFMAELIEAASRAIKNPGSASAAIPLLIKVKGELIEKFKHLTFATPEEEKLTEDRDRALARLANSLNVPAEVLTGMGAVNHWSAWQLEEAGVKLHICPPVEVVCNGLTESWLKPMAAAANLSTTMADGSEVIVWYDHSALVQQPDRTQQAKDLHGDIVITDESYRRDSGFEEADKPTDDQLKTQLLTKIAAAGGADAMAALSLLFPNDKKLAELAAPAPPPQLGPNPADSQPTDQPGSGPQGGEKPVQTTPDQPAQPTANPSVAPGR